MRDFVYRLGSRKFLLAVGGICVTVANKDYRAATAIVLAYLGVEGAADYKSRQV